MKSCYPAAILMLLALLVSFPLQAAQQYEELAKKLLSHIPQQGAPVRMAVVEFKLPEDKKSLDGAEYVQDELEIELGRDSRVTLITRTDLQTIQEEKEFQESGLVDSGPSQVAGIDVQVRGHVEVLSSGEVCVFAELVNVADGAISKEKVSWMPAHPRPAAHAAPTPAAPAVPGAVPEQQTPAPTAGAAVDDMLRKALMQNDIPLARQALEQGADSSLWLEGTPAIIYAINNDQTEMAGLLKGSVKSLNAERQIQCAKYYVGRGKQEDAQTCYELAADNGNGEAMEWLISKSVRESQPAEALRWYKLFSKDEGADEAALVRYFADKGDPVSDELALKLQGLRDPDAAQPALLYGIAQIYSPEDAKWRHWMERAASAGSPDAAFDYASTVYTDIVKLVTNPIYVEDAREASKWYEKAGKAGNVEAMNRMGALCYRKKCHHEHKTEDESLQSAVAWFKMAAELGSIKAKSNLANLKLGTSERVDLDMKTARRFLDEAAAAGDESAIKLKEKKFKK